jgi:predicted permease
MTEDLYIAARSLRRSPVFSVTIVALLALGIGANTAIFSLMNAVLLRTLPVREPDRLVLFNLKPPRHSSYYMIPQSMYRRIRDTNLVFEGFAAATFPPLMLGDGRAERVNGLLVSGTFFKTLGVNALLGRVITPEDDRSAVCVIGYGLWQRRFGNDPGVIGRRIQVNAHPCTVIGVTPKEFLGLAEDSQLDISIPLLAPGMSEFAFYPVQTFGRLKPGVSMAQAQASLDALYHHLASSDASVLLQPGRQGFSTLRSQYRKPLLLLMAMVGLVLLIACANIVNLLMARASRRTKEIAVRLALGAGRTRLVWQLLAECTLLAMSGAVAGIALAYWADHVLLALAPRQAGSEALRLDVNPDVRVLLFTLGVAILVSILCGLAPAVQSLRLDVGPALKGTAGVRAPGRFSFTKALVVAQVALSLVLLIGAGLFLRSLHNLKSVDPGLNPERLVVLTLDPGLAGYSKAASRNFFEDLVERTRNLPGVVAASPGFISPLSGGFAITHFLVPVYQPSRDEPDSLNVNWIGTDYFKVLATPLLAGRVFTEQDGVVNNVMIVNERTAKHFWPHESAIGKHAFLGWSKDDKFDPERDCEIVGVVKDVKSESLRKDAQPTVYLPFRQNNRPHLTLHVRVAGDTAPIISALLREIREMDPNVPAYRVTTMAAQVDQSTLLDRLMATLTSLFGLLAVVLAAVGLYGVMAFTVAARTREIGIRMALGAGRARVFRQVLRESAWLTAIGIALGVPGAWWASRFAASFLYELSAADPATYVGLALVLAGIALGAAWIPARRAASGDPMVALRYE